MIMPNFLIIGAAKCGTTSLYKYLQQHPQIYMSPIKETNFFASDFVNGKPQLRELDFCYGNTPKISYPVTSLEDYQALFAEVTTQKAIGEVSPAYLHRPLAPQRIKRHIPEVKLIAILRNPVDRAYSGYQMQVHNGRETREFSQNLNRDEIYIKSGFYYASLKRYFDTFDRDRLLILLYENLRRDSIGLMQTIFEFLNVDSTFVPDVSVRHNSGGVPKNNGIYNLIMTSKASESARAIIKLFIPKTLRQKLFMVVNETMLTKPQPLSPETRQQLVKIYREDMLKLQDLLQQDLSLWLN
jgi:hypothetical protein